jgi:hypothetical protein
VDIGALRPPRGAILSIDSPFEPEVMSAYAKAREVALVANRPQLNLACLLFGLLATKGPIACGLLRGAGKDPSTAEQELRTWFEPGNGIGEPSATMNYLQCQKLAENFALRAQTPWISEGDLWWTLLTQGSQSHSLQKACRHLGVDYHAWGKELAGLFPCPRLADSLSSSATRDQPQPSRL